MTMERNEYERACISRMPRERNSAEISTQDEQKSKKYYSKPVIETINIEPFVGICATSVVETCSVVQSAGQEIGDDFDFSDNTTFNQTWE